MNKYKIIIAFISLLWGLSACDNEEFLTVNNPNETTTLSFWQNDQHAMMGIIATYSAMQADDVMGGLGVSRRAYMGGLVYPRRWSAPNVSYYIFDMVSSEPFYEGQWEGLYTGIFRANQVLEFVPDIPMDEEEKEVILAEARFLRAQYYFWLAIYYNNGAIPLITTVPTSPDDIYQPLATRDEVYNTIYADLEAARAVLPETWNENNKGRATWGAATALLGKVHLYEQNWSEAAMYLEEVINSGLYSLVDDPNLNFNIEGEHNSESIFEVNFSDAVKAGTNQNSAFVDTPLGSEATGRARGWAPNGIPAGWATAIPHGALGDLLIKDTLDPGNPVSIGRTYSIRSEASVGFDGDELPYYSGVTKNVGYGQNYWHLVWRKFQNYDKEREDNVDSRSGINERLMRLADVYLMAAEALVQRDGAVSLVANEYLNIVRRRAGVAQRFFEDDLPSKEVFLDYLMMYERPRELCGEGFGIRWQDIRRWGIIERVNEELKGGFTAYPNLNVQTGTGSDQFEIRRANNFIPGTHEFFELPSTELLINIALGE